MLDGLEPSGLTRAWIELARGHQQYVISLFPRREFCKDDGDIEVYLVTGGNTEKTSLRALLPRYFDKNSL